jgi:aspartate ammonia-lyase
LKSEDSTLKTQPRFRVEKDLLGERRLPADALYGIHTLRAMENFPLSGRVVSADLIKAYALVKLACAETNKELGFFGDSAKFAAIEQACGEMASGGLLEHVKVDALQGGAGTSTNMNVNEVLANRALTIIGAAPGEYSKIHPLDDLNLHQSTNDTYPTALKVAMVFKLRELEKSLVRLLETLQRKEKEFADVVKIGRTPLQDAVLTTLGGTMSAFAEAVGRDRWRIFKCEERLRVVNLGGTAIGTGVSAPRKYIFKATDNLRRITGLGLARAENLLEATQNNDVFVEVSGILCACASNLMKISGDLRLLSSGPDAGFGELRLPKRQAGSSLMPGKVNPVIPEAVTQAAVVAVSNNAAIERAVSSGSLELNPFMPLIADKSLETLTLLTASVAILADFCVEGLVANRKKCAENVESSTAAVTALVGEIGYEKAQQIANLAEKESLTLKEAALRSGFVTKEEFEELTTPEAVNRLGSKTPRESANEGGGEAGRASSFDPLEKR